jgi:hypothetical protein
MTGLPASSPALAGDVGAPNFESEPLGQWVDGAIGTSALTSTKRPRPEPSQSSDGFCASARAYGWPEPTRWVRKGTGGLNPSPILHGRPARKRLSAQQVQHPPPPCRWLRASSHDN